MGNTFVLSEADKKNIIDEKTFSKVNDKLLKNLKVLRNTYYLKEE